MPAPGKRPGGLTFLAALDFVFAACWVVAMLVLQFVIRLKEDPSRLPAGLEERAVLVIQAAMSLPTWLLWERVIGGAVKVILWVTGGVALLKMRRIARLLATAYALFSITEGVIGVAGGSSVPAELVGCLFPALTLVLVNGVFKDALVK